RSEATVELARLDLQNTRIVAPRDGTLGEVGVRLGQYVTAGTQLVSIVPKTKWVMANFKETQLYGMKVGQPVTFTVDALRHAELTGHIEAFAPAAGSEFSVIKSDNATRSEERRVGKRAGIHGPCRIREASTCSTR